jgi:hypothetical protein
MDNCWKMTSLNNLKIENRLLPLINLSSLAISDIEPFDF